jgi:hypothetical protein
MNNGAVSPPAMRNVVFDRCSVQRRELQSSRLNEHQRVNYERSGRALADSNRVPATPAAT